jgi:hypothetical protein
MYTLADGQIMAHVSACEQILVRIEAFVLTRPLAGEKLGPDWLNMWCPLFLQILDPLASVDAILNLPILDNLKK